jgi:hypothetical protein
VCFVTKHCYQLWRQKQSIILCKAALDLSRSVCFCVQISFGRSTFRIHGKVGLAVEVWWSGGLAVWTCLREVVCSNIDRDTGYIDKGTSWVSSVPPSKCRDVPGLGHCRVSPKPFQFTCRHTTRRYIAKILTTIPTPYSHCMPIHCVSHVVGINKQKQTPWPLVRERTIPTDRPPLVDEI